VARSRITALLAGAALAATLAAAGCIRAGGPTGGPVEPEGEEVRGDEPVLRIGLQVGQRAVTLGGGGALRVDAGGAGLVAGLPAGRTTRVVAGDGGSMVLALDGGEPVTAVEIVVAPSDRDGTVRLGTREYRGEIVLRRDREGITVVNRVGIERYLESVVASEMGRRTPDEIEALKAQTVVSRTYALRNVGRWRAQGFDLQATVADQVYNGAGVVYPLVQEAVASTRGQVVTYAGAPIDAFFYSTCGGRTAQGTEIFRGAARPYLQSVSDEGPDGDYCRVSPRYRWTETWTGEQLRAVLGRSLPEVTGGRVARVRAVKAVRVTDRTGSGRAAGIAIRLGTGADVHVDAPQVRAALRSPTGEILRSNLFTLSASHARGEVSRLVAEGGGAGHGVGFCQWGSVGRARAGHSYDRIVAAYFPVTTLERLY
jgi:stage II sporulation protein D